jgi:hypothetical protein
MALSNLQSLKERIRATLSLRDLSEEAGARFRGDEILLP